MQRAPSLCSAERLREALAVSRNQGLPRYEVIQPRYNLYDRDDFESGLGGLAEEHGLGVVSYFSLASGFLTGKYRGVQDLAGSARADFLKGYFDDRGQRLLNTLLDVAKEIPATPAQVALAWLMACPGLTAPIATATSLPQLDELLEAPTLSLPEQAMARLETLDR